jgi:hypothetical protein
LAGKYDHHWGLNPTPENDYPRHWIKQSEACGFVDLDQLQQWFTPPLLEGLQQAGFMLAKYEAINPTVQQRQVVFTKGELLCQQPLPTKQ